MEGEEKNKEEGLHRLEESLHNKSALPSLRTYQGDMAEFIKEKNESVISVAIKEKVHEEKKKEEIKEKQKTETEQTEKPKKMGGFQINLTILLSSLLLIAGGTAAFFYIWQEVQKPPKEEPLIQNEMIPYNKIITLANVTKETLGPELQKIAVQNGISLIKISNTNGKLVATTKDFFDFLKVSPPSALLRNLKNGFALGAISQNKENAFFLVITVDDFGVAFSSMLEWEEGLSNDLSFLSQQTANGAATTTKVAQGPFVWKDTIVKNKDVRAFMNTKYDTKAAYTFLDKNTVLIVGDIYAVEGISSAYASRSFTR